MDFFLRVFVRDWVGCSQPPRDNVSDKPQVASSTRANGLFAAKNGAKIAERELSPAVQPERRVMSRAGSLVPPHLQHSFTYTVNNEGEERFAIPHPRDDLRHVALSFDDIGEIGDLALDAVIDLVRILRVNFIWYAYSA